MPFARKGAASAQVQAAGGPVATLVIVVAGGSILLGALNPLLLPWGVRPLLGNLVQLTAPLAALGACAMAARRSAVGRRSWLLFGAACLSAVLGQLLWARDEVLLRVPVAFPSASFWLFALVHVFLISGVLLALKPARVPRLRVEISLDGALLLLAAAFLILRFILEPPLLQGWIDRSQAVAMLLGQVLSAGSLLFALGLLVWRDTLLPPRSLNALAGAALLFELGNVLVAFGFDPHPAASGDAFELWWVVAWAALALAGLAAADPQPPPPPSGSRERVARRVRASLLPGVAIFLAVGGVDAATRHYLSSLSIIVLLLLGGALAVRIGNAFWAVEREARLRHEAEQLAHRARLQAIANQLNPHFLFNTLHSVSALVEAEPSRAELALNRLGALLRYTVGGGEEQLVALAEEWSFTTGYLELEQLRLGDRLRSELDAEDAALDCLVPPLLVQPLVENAVRHGIAPRPEGGRVRLSARLDAGLLSIVVSDDGPGGSAAEAGGGIGLRGVRARLAAAFGDAARMEVNTSPGRGFSVSLTLPALEEEGP